MGRPIRILLVEDNKVFREALELLLGLRADIEIVARVGDGSEAVAAAASNTARRRADGLPPARARRRAGDRAPCSRPAPDVAVVCLTASANAREIEALYEAGAAACLRRTRSSMTIVDAIKRAAGRDERRCMNLTADNTAIVLDSTADFPDAAAALPELARRPALRELRRPRASATAST